MSEKSSPTRERPPEEKPDRDSQVLVHAKGSARYSCGWYFGPGCWTICGERIAEADIIGWLPMPVPTMGEPQHG